MKKNFFKKLSFVMALAMVLLTLAPAASAFAATSPSLNVDKKYLYLNEEGKISEYDFNVKNKVAGTTYAWSSDNEAVAEVDAANGVTVAKAVGTAHITVAMKKGTKTTKLTATVVVRDNIETIDVSNVPATNLTVNQEYDFNRSFVTFNGSTAKTSSISRWSVSGTGATIEATTGKFVATAAGTYDVTVSAFQSSALYAAGTYTATKTIKVTVAPSMTVTQKDLDTITVAFDSAMTDVAKNLSIVTLVGTTEVAVTTAKPITMSADNKTATIDFYVPLTEKATYRVKYTGSASKEFVAASTEIEKVSKVVVKTTEAVVNASTDVAVQLFDANGVDITNTTLSNRVTLTSSSAKVYLDANNKKVVFFTKGETTTIEATFHTYKYEAGKEIGNVVGTGTIVGVDAYVTAYGTVKAWTMVAAGPVFTDVKHTLTVGETKKLFVQLNTNTNGTAGTVDNSAAGSKITFTSSDSSVLFIDNSTFTLYPVKAGSVTVVVKYDGTSVDVLNITVGAERKATSLVLGTTSVTLSNSTAVADSSDVSVKVKDQYGDDFTVGAVTVEKMAGSPATEIATPGAGKVTFNGVVLAASAVKGTYYYKVTAQSLSAYVTVTVLEPTAGGVATSYQLQLSSADVDNKSTTDDATPTLTIDLFGYAGGTKTSHPAVTGAGFTVVVTNPDGANTTITSSTYNLYTASGSAITPLKSGTYTVTAKNASGVAVDIKYFNVKNTQTKPSFELKSSVYTTASVDPNVIARECFKVSFDGTEKTDFVMGDYLGTLGGQIFVKNLKWTQSITDASGTYTITHTIDVNQYINK